MRNSTGLDEIAFLAAQARKEADRRSATGNRDAFLSRLAVHLEQQVEALRAGRKGASA